MKFLAFIQHQGFQSLIVLILSVALCGIGLVYRQQSETRDILQQLLIQDAKQKQSAQLNEQLISLLKNIQANQAEIKTLLDKLAASKTESNPIPASKMKRFKQGAFKPAKAKGY